MPLNGPYPAVEQEGLWSTRLSVAAELAAVERFLQRVSGESAALVIEGEAGIGKTTVWLEAVLGPLRSGQVDAAVLPEPFLTLAAQRGARRVANIFHAVCREDCLLTAWLARRDMDPTLAARFRNAVQAAAVWANREQNDAASGAILARYAPIDKAVIARMTRTRFATRLRPASAQPWIDAYAEFGVISASFRALDLVK